jgi:hypothetical protein
MAEMKYLLHGGEFKHPKRLVQETEDFMQQFRLATIRADETEETSRQDNPSPTRWSPPRLVYTR